MEMVDFHTSVFIFMKSCKGLLDGYVAEKAILEEMLQQKETLEESLVEELENLKMKMHQMQGLTAELDSLRSKHQQLAEEHAALLRQKDHLSAGLGEREKGKQSKHQILKSYGKYIHEILMTLTTLLCNVCAP